ncbi:Reticulon-like protein, partial [Drosera capensis]
MFLSLSHSTDQHQKKTRSRESHSIPPKSQHALFTVPPFPPLLTIPSMEKTSNPTKKTTPPTPTMAAEKTEPLPSTPTRRLTRAQTAGISAGKRKTWRSESLERNPSGNSVGNGSVGDGIKRSPSTTIPIKKTRSELGSEKKASPGQLKQTRSGVGKENEEGNSDSSSKMKIEFDRVRDGSGKEIGDSGRARIGSEETEENRSVGGKLGNVGSDKYSLKSDGGDGDGDGVDCDCDEDVLINKVDGIDELMDDVDGDENGLVDDDDDGDDEDEEELDEENLDDQIEVEKECLDVKELNVVVVDEKCENEISDARRSNSNHISNLKSKPSVSSVVVEQIPALKNKPINVTGNFPKHRPNPIGDPDECQRNPETHSKLQSLVDLIMWRDVSRSAFVFGIGTFVVVSSSYTKEINISLISVISYLGLIYLAATFFYRSIICRGVIDVDHHNNDCFGEEEAMWLLRLLLPYVNEFLLKIRSLFSGDPAMTMKLAVVLFVLARCGNSITIWKLAKLGFFGVFTVPKFCSSYSSHIAAYGKFWIRRFWDASQSCTHKKAVALVIFTLFWNMSAVVARIWGAFMLYVAFRYYQQSLIDGDDWVNGDAAGVSYEHSTQNRQVGRRRAHVQGSMHTSIDLRKKEKKR